jgi:hypothetical protein
MNEVEQMEKLLKLIDEFKAEYEEEQKKLPYNLNIIDELRANENTHTRILMKLLEYKQSEKYLFLESFLSKVGITISISNPNFCIGEAYIDGLIKEQNSYAVIIENKIHNAADQDKQIERYIQKVKDYPQIIVLYLTRDGSKFVKDNSYTLEAKQMLKGKGKFISINYRDHILPWLKEDVLPNCLYKDHILILGIELYIDHLEGILNLRNMEKNMNDELKELVKKEFDEIDKLEDKARQVDEQIGIVNKYLSLLQDYQREQIDQKMCKEFLPKFDQDFPEPRYKRVNGTDSPYPTLGIEKSYNGLSFCIAISVENGFPFYGCYAKDSEEAKKYSDVQTFLGPIRRELGMKSLENNWYCYEWKDKDDVYDAFKKFVTAIEERLKEIDVEE